jgi:hypothetical protein
MSDSPELCILQAEAYQRISEAYVRMQSLIPQLRIKYAEIQASSRLEPWKHRDREYNQLQMMWHDAFKEFRLAVADFNNLTEKIDTEWGGCLAKKKTRTRTRLIMRRDSTLPGQRLAAPLIGRRVHRTLACVTPHMAACLGSHNACGYAFPPSCPSA